MNLLIIIIVTVLYAVIIGWTWSSLGDIERKKKILITGIGILLVYLITLLLFNISKNQIQYPDISAEKYVKNILVIIFTGINSIAILLFLQT